MTSSENVNSYVELEQQRAELQAQMDALTKKAEEVKALERDGAIAEVQKLVNIYSMTKNDVRLAKITKNSAKYLDPVTGISWSGLGNKPACFHGKDMTDYLIKKA